MPSPSTPLVRAENLGLILPDGRRLLGGVDLSFGREGTGLIGANGAGKSILLDALVGVRPPDEGAVTRAGRLAYVPQATAGHRAAVAGETVADRLGVRERLDALARVLAGEGRADDLDRIGPDGWSLPERVRAELARLGLEHLPPERPIDAVSGGEAMRVALAGAFLQRPDLLVLDEPTNDLDAPSREALLAALSRWSGGLLVVTHDRRLLRRVDRILEIVSGGVREYGGAYDAYREARDRERAAAEAERSEAEAALRRARAEARRVRERQERRAARGRRSRREGGMPKILLNARREGAEGTTARLARVTRGVEEAAEERARAAKERVDEVAVPRLDVAPSGLPAGRDVLVLEDLTCAAPGSDHPLFEAVSLVVRGPERIAITGPNGSGKTTLLRTVMGEHPPLGGRVDLRLPPDRVAWLDQRAEVLTAGQTVLSCFRIRHPEWDEGEARHLLARYLFPGDAALAPVERLSGGERMRAALACLLGGVRAPELLLLDEPTNHLDLETLETVERAVAAYDGALLVVSHDEDFLEAIGVDRRIRLGPPGP